MPGKRKITPSGVGDADTRVAVLLPKDVGRQLRALAARRNSAVAPILREWIIEKLASEASPPPGGCVARIIAGELDRGHTPIQSAVRSGSF